MASRKLFEDFLPSTCSCKNVCNRTTSRRGGCPCQTAEVYCSSSCSCGTARQQCANRPGKGGELDKQLGISSEDSDPEPDVDSDPEPDVDSDPEPDVDSDAEPHVSAFIFIEQLTPVAHTL